MSGLMGTFDPEGTGYDYTSAIKTGLSADKTGHWPSRDPKTGLILKGRKHKTWNKTVKGEKAVGYEIYKKNGRYYSKKKKKSLTSKAERPVTYGRGKGALQGKFRISGPIQ